jgi:hypothetical protein
MVERAATRKIQPPAGGKATSSLRECRALD